MSQEIDFKNQPAGQPDLKPQVQPLVEPQNDGQASLIDQVINSKNNVLQWERITLPSLGLWYNGQIPGGVVEIKPFSIHEDKILANQRLVANGTAIDLITNNCLRLPNNFNPAELLVGDRAFLFYAMRGITHGNIYSFVSKCPACKNQSAYEQDLNVLINNVKEGNPALGQEPFRVTLPKLTEAYGKDIWVEVRFPRGFDLAHVTSKSKFNRRINKANNEEELVTSQMATQIVSFMGVDKDPFKIESLVDTLHARDSAVISEFLRHNQPGIDLTCEFTCPECSEMFRTILPLTETFFRPKSI